MELQIGFEAAAAKAMWMLTNADDDVRRYAWRIISATISIFAAVLFFVGNNELLDAFLEPFELSEAPLICIHFGHFAIASHR